MCTNRLEAPSDRRERVIFPSRLLLGLGLRPPREVTLRKTRVGTEGQVVRNLKVSDVTASKHTTTSTTYAVDDCNDPFSADVPKNRIDSIAWEAED